VSARAPMKGRRPGAPKGERYAERRGNKVARLPLAVRLEATSPSHGAGAPHGSIPRARLPGTATLGATVTPYGAHRVGFTLPSSGSSTHRPAPRGFCHGSPRTRAGDGYPSGTARSHPLSLSLATGTLHLLGHARDPHRHKPRPLSPAWGHHPLRVGTGVERGKIKNILGWDLAALSPLSLHD